MKLLLQFFEKEVNKDELLFDRIFSIDEKQFRYHSDKALVWIQDKDSWLPFENWTADGPGLGVPEFDRNEIHFKAKYKHPDHWRSGLALEKNSLLNLEERNFLRVHGLAFFGLPEDHGSKVFILEEDGHLSELSIAVPGEDSFIIDFLFQRVYRLEKKGHEYILVSVAEIQNQLIELSSFESSLSLKSESGALNFVHLAENDIFSQLERRQNSDIDIEETNLKDVKKLSSEPFGQYLEGNFTNLLNSQGKEDLDRLSKELISLVSLSFLSNQFEEGFSLIKYSLILGNEECREFARSSLNSLSKGKYPELSLKGFSTSYNISRFC